MWSRGFKRLRAAIPAAVIVGPSIWGGADPESAPGNKTAGLFNQWLDETKANGTSPDAGFYALGKSFRLPLFVGLFSALFLEQIPSPTCCLGTCSTIPSTPTTTHLRRMKYLLLHPIQKRDDSICLDFGSHRCTTVGRSRSLACRPA